MARGDARDDTVRVLVLTDHVGGGTGRHLLALHEALAHSRVATRILSTGRVHFHGPEADAVGCTRPAPALHRFPVAQAWNLMEVTRALRAAPVHVLHTYGFWPIVYGRALRRAGVVQHLVENRESIDTDWRQGGFRLLRASRSLPERVICVSRSVAEYVVGAERLDEAQVRVIENGAPEQRWPVPREEARRRLGIPASAYVVGAVSSHLDRPVKGLSCLIDAMRDLVTQLADVTLLLVGAWSPGGPTIAALRAGHLLVRTILLGYREDVDLVYPAMDTLAMSSQSEGLPIAILEAMSHALPVVATQVGGTREVVLSEETGFLVRAGDAGALASHLLSLARQPALRASMGVRAQRRFREHFHIRRTAERYKGLYEELVRA